MSNMLGWYWQGPDLRAGCSYIDSSYEGTQEECRASCAAHVTCDTINWHPAKICERRAPFAA